MKNAGRTLAFVVALGGTLAACGSTPPPQPRTGPRTAAPPQPPEKNAGSTSPWDELTPEQLSKMVTDAAHARIREAQPDFDVAKIADYRGAPDSAPMIGGRTASALLDLAVVDLVGGRHEDAEKTILLVRARAKNRNLTFTGVAILAEAKRRAGADGEARQAAVEQVLGTLPKVWLNSAARLYDAYRNIDQVLTEINVVRAQMVSPDSAGKMLYLQQVLTTIVSERQTYVRAVEAVRLGRQSDPPRPRFAFSTADISKRKAAKIVRVGVWDLGTNPAAFEGAMFHAMERDNGQDDDGDGLVDNEHGVVADGAAPQKAYLYDPGADVLSTYASKLRGMGDLRVGLADSDDGMQLVEMKQGVSDPAARAALDRNLDAVWEWAHGTHLAGIVLQGNAKAKLAVFRTAWAGGRPYVEHAPTDEDLAAERRSAEQIARFLKKNAVTVVAVGIDTSLRRIQDQLRGYAGAFADDAALQARAQQIHTHRMDTYRAAFAGAPGTLFVVAAGDDNQDVVEFQAVPASLEASNVIAVGAIDQYGDWGIFTNSGDRVRLFDLGVEVESEIPSGEQVRLSGTAMAAANVANLAGKMMSINELLMPEQVVEIMLANSVELSAPFSGKVAHEQRSVDQAWTARGRRRPPTP